MRIQHISFDLWLTLLKSNPEFKRKKIDLFFREYNPNHLPLSEVEAIIRNADVESTRVAEVTQKHFDTLSLISIILIRLGNTDHQLGDLKILHENIQQLYIANPPFLYSEDTADILKKLYFLVDVMTVGSNTGFVDGVTVVEGLKRLKINHYFDDYVFSDQCGFAKPSPDFFQLVHSIFQYDKESILHVGDNPFADGFGAKQYGINDLIINSNKKSIKDVLTLVRHQNKVI